ncbi:MAG: flavodoxin family protein [Deltaproteobacteria bacterium]|jgi:multimeric flavodoxin WrbA|nr:flavodoxin family protein [Deltaproteobacteria bacterium]
MEENAKGERLVVAINGGPRKGWNTDTLLQRVLDGAKEAGADTLCVDLYRLRYRGCVSCFACKKEANYRRGICVMRDELAGVLGILEGATGLVMGSPIYLGDVTGALRSFLERYLFMNLVYGLDEPPVLERGPGIAMLYTMGVPESMLQELGYDRLFASHLKILARLNAPFVESMVSCDTYQFKDYSKYHAPMFDEAHKASVRATDFPRDLERAFDIGKRLGSVTERPRRHVAAA